MCAPSPLREVKSGYQEWHVVVFKIYVTTIEWAYVCFICLKARQNRNLEFTYYA